MVWAEDWTIQIDGSDVNTLHTGGYLVAEIPQLQNGTEYEQVSVEIAGDWPSFIRLQPTSASWSLNIAMTPCDWSTFETRRAALEAILTPGVHTLSVQVRGMASPLSTTVVVAGRMIEPKARVLSYTLYVPKPELA